MRLKFMLASVCVSLFFTGCVSTGEKAPMIAGKCSVDTPACDLVSLMGEYSAVLPCADCEGIEVSLSFGLREFNYKAVYTNTNETDTQTGTYKIENDIITTTNLYKETQKYKYVNGDLLMLDKDAKEITGETAEFYKFKKVRN